MKIMYLASSAVPTQAANSVHVVKMANAYAGLGHDVILVAPEYGRVDSSPCSDDALNTYYGVNNKFRFKKTRKFLSGRLCIIPHLLQVLFLAFQFNPDVVHARCIYSALLLNFFGFRVLCERHDVVPSKSLSQKAFKFTAKMKPFHRLVVVSQALKSFYVMEYGLNPEFVLVAPDAADPIAEGATPALAHSGRVMLGYTGHLYQGRGIDVIGKIAKEMPDAEFHIVGGLEEDIAFWRNEFSESRNIIFHGYIAPARVSSYIQSFDILLAPYQQKVSISGGGDTSKWMSPLKIFEYMSSGRAIICSDIPVLREVLRDEDNCLLCDPADFDQWKRAILRIVNDATLRQRITDNALSEFLEKYTWNARAQNILMASL